MSTLGRVAARGAGVTAVSQALRIVIQLGSLLILSRFLNPHEVGLVAMVTSVIGVADLIRDFGLSSGAIQAPTLSTDERSNLFWVNLGLGAACSVVAALLAPLLALIYGIPEITDVTLVLSVLFLLSGATTQHRADLMRHLRFNSLAYVDLSAQFLASAAAVLAAYLGAGYWAMVVQQAGIVVVTLVGCLLAGRWWPRWFRRGIGTRKFFTFGWPILGTNLLGYAINNVDNIGIGIVWGARSVGLYTRAYQLLLNPLSQINAPLNTVVLPTLSRVQEDPPTFDAYVRRLNLVSCYLFGFALALLAGLSWPLVAILLGPSWSETAPIFAVLALGGIFKALTMVTYQAFVARGRTRALFKMYLVTRPVMLVLILAGLPWGPLGVAAGHLVAALWFWWYSIRAVERVVGADLGRAGLEAVRAVLVVSLPAAALAYACTLTGWNPWAQCFAGLAAALVWVAATALLPAVRSDLRTVTATVALALPARR